MNVLSHSDKRSLRESAYKCRRKLLPVLPKSYDEAMDQLKNRQTSTLHRGQQFCFVIDEIPIFTTESNLRFLYLADDILGDGTFSYSPKYFTQLYTVHVCVNNFYIPIVYCFLRDKLTETYKRM